MTKHGIVKCNGVSAEPNSILRVVLIEEAAREYLRGKPQTLRLLLEQLRRQRRCQERRGEDWTVAKEYVRSRLRRLA
jgi:hypothetical protein